MVFKTPIDPALRTRHLKVSENKRRQFYGLLLAGDGSLHLLATVWCGCPWMGLLVAACGLYGLIAAGFIGLED